MEVLRRVSHLSTTLGRFTLSRTLITSNPQCFPALLLNNQSSLKEYGLSENKLANPRILSSIASYQKSIAELIRLGVNEKELKKIQNGQLSIASANAEKRPIFRPIHPIGTLNYEFASDIFPCKEFISFAHEQGIDLKVYGFSKFEDNAEDLYTAVILFGKEICRKHPIIFQDIFHYLPRKLPQLFGAIENLVGMFSRQSDEEIKKFLKESDTLKKFDTEFSVACIKQVIQWKKDPEMKKQMVPPEYPRELLCQLKKAPETEWYKFQDTGMSGLPWTMFLYLRTLPDAIFEKADSNPELTAQVYEKVGLMAAPLFGHRLQMEMIPAFADIRKYDDWKRDPSMSLEDAE